MPRERGTISCYRAGCDHPECRESNNAWQRQRTRLMAYGKWAPYVDAGPARDHAKRLQAAGIGVKRIAELAGLGSTVVSYLIYGKPSDGRPPASRIRPETAAAVLAVRPDLEAYAPAAIVDATGTRRRIQALSAIGWSITRLARELESRPSTVHRYLRSPGVEARTAIAVRALYDRLWNVRPSTVTKSDRISVSHAVSNARRHGWVPPLAWDDESIDDPAASPVGAGVEKRRRTDKLPPAEDLWWLIQGGDSIEVIADRYGATVSSVRQCLDRARKETTS